MLCSASPQQFLALFTPPMRILTLRIMSPPILRITILLNVTAFQLNALPSHHSSSPRPSDSNPCRCKSISSHAVAVLYHAIPLPYCSVLSPCNSRLFIASPLHIFSFPLRSLSGLFTAATPRVLVILCHCLSNQHHSFTQQFRAYPLQFNAVPFPNLSLPTHYHAMHYHAMPLRNTVRFSIIPCQSATKLNSSMPVRLCSVPQQCLSQPFQDKSIRCRSNTELYPYDTTRCHSIAKLLLSFLFPNNTVLFHRITTSLTACAVVGLALPPPFLSQRCLCPSKLFNALTLLFFSVLIRNTATQRNALPSHHRTTRIVTL